jgi:integrase
LIDATEVLILPDREPPARAMVRRALREWTFSAQLRADGKPPIGAATPPADIAHAVQWLERNTIRLADFAGDQGAVLARTVLDRISRKQDGKVAAANTANRKRTVLNNAMEYACEIRALPVNPLKQVKWTKQRTLRSVDPGVVINSRQARRFLAEVEARKPRLAAFFGCMYYAALRPEEAIDLRRDNLIKLPGKGWGEMRLTNAEPRSGTHWTDNGKSRERRPLKHRADGDTRLVPIHPELVALLRAHLERVGSGRDGRLFIGPRGGVVAEWSYLAVFRAARKAALSAEEAASPLMGVPYDLRHAAVSTWLNATGDPPQVAEWAGHSVDVLLRVYAKCIAGQQDQAKLRIEEAMKPSAGDTRGAPPADDDDPAG